MTAATQGALLRLSGPVVLPARARARLELRAPLTVIRGTAGFGKTTLLAGWLAGQSSGVRPVWLRGVDVVLPQALEGLAEVCEAARERVVLVIDDADSLQHRAVLDDLLDLVRSHASLQLMLCSRTRHPIEELARGVVDTVTLTPNLLRLDAGEILELARGMSVDLSPRQAQRLRDALGGWPAPVRAVLSETEPGEESLSFIAAERYVAEVALEALRADRELAPVLPILLADRLTVGLAADLLHDAGRGARAVVDAGLAERVRGDVDVELRVPPVVRSALCAAFERDRRTAAGDVHDRLRAWYERHDGPGHTLYAFRHAAAAADQASLERLWIHHAATLTLDHPRELATVLAEVHGSVTAARPAMMVARRVLQAAASAAGAIVEGPGVPAALRAYADVSRALASRPLDSLPLHDLLWLGSGLLVSLRDEGKFAEAEALACDVERSAAAKTARGEDPGDGLAWFHLQRGILATLSDGPAAGIGRYERSWEYRWSTAAAVAGLAAGHLALAHAFAGHAKAARQWLERHRRVDTGLHWSRAHVRAPARIAAALLALDRLDKPAAEAALADLGDGSAAPELWPFVSFLRAQYGLFFGDPVAALAELDGADRSHAHVAAPSRAVRNLLDRARADLLLAAGGAQRAHALVADSDRGGGFPAVAHARVALLAGEVRLARRIATDHVWRKSTDNRVRLEMLLVLASASYRDDDVGAARELMRTAVTLYHETEMLGPFALLGPMERETLVEVADRSLGGRDLEVLTPFRTPFPERAAIIRLTRREMELAQALVTTGSRQDLADQFFVSVNTIRKQLVSLYRKLRVGSRAEALARVAELGLLQSQDDSAW